MDATGDQVVLQPAIDNRQSSDLDRAAGLQRGGQRAGPAADVVAVGEAG
jgi:hypothetical protein